jgi:signal transduction histidine kinase
MSTPIENDVASFPVADTAGEEALFACATHVLALRGALGKSKLEHLNLMLAFVRTAHFWTKLHPELTLEDDVIQLLAAHETLAECILKDPDARGDSLSRQVDAELESLRKLRKQHDGMTQAFQELSVNHQYVKHSLLETEENLRELVSVMPAAIYACDKDGTITYYNRQAVEMWGRRPDLNDHPWAFPDSRRIYRGNGTLLRPEDTPIKEVLGAGAPIVNCELVLERPDLFRINILANITPLRDTIGLVTGAVCVFQNITELKGIQLERERLVGDLERSNRELSRFSYAVSHDLQAPVRNVRALTQILAEGAQGLRGDSSHVLHLIEQATVGMERLIESLLRYAQAGQGELNRQSVPVQPIIESVCTTLAPLIVDAGAQIVRTVLPADYADPILLEQVIQNLVANAIKYRHPDERPVVEITCRVSGEGWQFTVKDNGQGIPRDYQDSIFEPLKRLHGSEIAGTGLGLALCRTIVTRHGGRIWVESGTDRGATFHFTLAATKELHSMPQVAL